MKITFDEFVPHPIAKGGHLQTILPRLLDAPPTLPNSEHMDIDLEDGDRTYARIDHPISGARPDTPILALFHGLGGCSESAYKRRIAARGISEGLRVARFSHRGCGQDFELSAKGIYHSGSKDDVIAGLVALTQRYPEAPVAVVGFSLSGAMVLNMLGHYPEIQKTIPQLQIAAAVCPPVDLVESSKLISKFSNIIYDQYYTRLLLKHTKRRAIKFKLKKPEFSKKMVTLALFDNEFTAPAAGYRDAAHYYQECSPARILKNIKLPTLILGAEDDPVVNPQGFADAKQNLFIHLSVQKSGGHMGFLSRYKTRYGDNRWLEEALVTWCASNLKSG